MIETFAVIWKEKKSSQFVTLSQTATPGEKTFQILSLHLRTKEGSQFLCHPDRHNWDPPCQEKQELT